MFDEVKGFAVTAKRLFRPTTTVQYPKRSDRCPIATGAYRHSEQTRRQVSHSASPVGSVPDLPDILPGNALFPLKRATAS